MEIPSEKQTGIFPFKFIQECHYLFTLIRVFTLATFWKLPCRIGGGTRWDNVAERQGKLRPRCRVLIMSTKREKRGCGIEWSGGLQDDEMDATENGSLDLGERERD